MISPIPNIPTDNLYKFLFISGLTLVFSGIILFFTQSNHINEKIDQVKFEQEKVQAKNEILLEELESLPSKSNYKTTKRQVDLNHIHINLKINQNKIYFTRYIFSSIVSFLLIIIGISIAKSGYKKWKELVQKPMDEKTKIELEILRRKNSI